MTKENNKDLKKSADEKLADDTLEQVSGGQIELVEDESTRSEKGKIVTRGISGSGGGHWA